jgi:hypothetical protein
MKKYKIIERHGIFIVYYAYKVFSLFKFKMIEKWNVAYKGIYMPAHFDTLYDAKKWIAKMQKPDVEHLV